MPKLHVTTAVCNAVFTNIRVLIMHSISSLSARAGPVWPTKTIKRIYPGTDHKLVYGLWSNQCLIYHASQNEYVKPANKK